MAMTLLAASFSNPFKPGCLKMEESDNSLLPASFPRAVFLGGAGKAAADATTGGGSIPPEKLALYVVGAAATILVTKLISNAASKAFEEARRVDQ